MTRAIAVAAIFGLVCMCLHVSGAVASIQPVRGGAATAASMPYQTSVNMVDLWWRWLGTANGGSTASKQALQDAAAAGFKYTRFAATAFWPIQMDLYKTNPEQYWNGFDELVAFAGETGVQLVPSILWNMHLFADMCKEPLGRMFVADSCSHHLLHNYTVQIVSRYANTPTIMMWELGNEHNLLADLNMTGSTNLCAPSLGTPAHRTAADNFSTDALIALHTQMAGWIRGADLLHRKVNTGNAIPRIDAEHLRASYHAPERDWTADTADQFQTNLLDVNSCCDTLSIHFYNHSAVRLGFTDPVGTGVLDLISYFSSKAAKPMYLGEFGEDVGTDYNGPRPFSTNVLDSIVKNCIPMSTVWIWEFSSGSGYNLSPTISPAYVKATQSTNAVLAKQCNTAL